MWVTWLVLVSLCVAVVVAVLYMAEITVTVAEGSLFVLVVWIVSAVLAVVVFGPKPKKRRIPSPQAASTFVTINTANMTEMMSVLILMVGSLHRDRPIGHLRAPEHVLSIGRRIVQSSLPTCVAASL